MGLCFDGVRTVRRELKTPMFVKKENIGRGKRHIGLGSVRHNKNAFGGDSTELGVEVLTLFTSMLGSNNNRFEYLEEVVKAANRGSIDVHKAFNLKGFEYKVGKFNMLADVKDLNVCTSLNFRGIEGDSREVLDTVSAREDPFSDVHYKLAFEYILSKKEEYLEDRGISLSWCLLSALKGVPKAIRTLKELCKESKDLSDSVFDILSHGITSKDIEVLEEV